MSTPPQVSDPSEDWAASGVVTLTGRPDGPPLVPPGRAATVARELGAHLAMLTAGFEHPVRVDGARLLSERAAFTGGSRAGARSVGGSCRLLPTANGWAAVSLARPDDVALVGALVGGGLMDDPWQAVAAWLSGHTNDDLAEGVELLGLPASPVPTTVPRSAPPTALGPRSVAGLRVVDFSALWAGPLCSHLLGSAGADVIKVETPQRPDGARRGNPDFYRLLHGGHRSVVLDPATTSGRRALAALVEAADIVVEASRPRALARWGLDAQASVGAGKTWISITAAGRGSDRVGFGDDVAAGAGLVALDADETPVFCGDALADPLTGLTAAALALTAPDDGSGVLWDVAMADVVAATLPSEPLRASPTSARRSRAGWVVETEEGEVPVALPRARAATGTAPAPGAHTAEVLAELGIPLP